MNRKYSKEDIKKVANNLRKNFKDVMLTADIIVGFPGETNEEFEETYKLLEEIKLYKIHVFQYSKREGTRAAKFENQILPKIKEERSKKLIELSNSMQEEYNKAYIGKKIKVLVEEKVKDYYKGHAENYMCVIIKEAKKDIKNQIVEVVIKDIQNELLVGA